VFEYTEWIFASNLPYRDSKPKYISGFFKENMALMASDGRPSPNSPFLRFGLALP